MGTTKAAFAKEWGYVGKMTSLVSVVVTTYNWPEALSMVLKSLADQKDRNFEIVIADDGSGD